MSWFRSQPTVVDSWSVGVRAVFLPGGEEVLAFAVLPATVAPVQVRVLEMRRFPWEPWREHEYLLTAEVVGRLHATFAREYPDLLPTDPSLGLDGIDVELGVERVGAQPADCRRFRFRMWSCDCSTVPAVEVAWDLLDPWRLELLGSQKQAGV